MSSDLVFFGFKVQPVAAESVRTLARLKGTTVSDVLRSAALPVVRAQLRELLSDSADS